MKHLQIFVASIEGSKYVAAGSRGKQSWDEYTTLDCLVPSVGTNITVKFNGKYDESMGRLVKVQYHAKGELYFSGEEIPSDYFKLRCFIMNTDKVVDELKKFSNYRAKARRELALSATLKGK